MAPSDPPHDSPHDSPLRVGSLEEPPEVFSEAARRAIYDVIALRRDVRIFRDEPVDPAVLERILGAAHLAPSVGFSQPWGFIVVRSLEVRTRIHESFQACRAVEAQRFEGARREKYLGYRLEGILEAPLNLAVVVDERPRRLAERADPRAEAILGTTAQPDVVRASVSCAIQNLWLAARAEGIGVGWVSIVDPRVLSAELGLPEGVDPVAYLCVGHPVSFRDRPMLEETGWRARRPLSEVIHWHDRWEPER